MQINNEIYLGGFDTYNKKLALLANMAQPEIWSFGKDRDRQPFRILENYIRHTYLRLKEENKLVVSSDSNSMCMNTGLLTPYNQEIVAVFRKNTTPDREPWFLAGFFKENDQHFKSCFSELPQIADYTDDVQDLIFDKNLDLNLNKEHIIDDNFERFERVGFTNKEMINYMLDAAILVVKKKLQRNFKLALPSYYRDKKSGNNKIQLLVPLYFPGASVRLALVLDKCRSDQVQYYLARTVLLVEWAYMNARLIVRPDEEWARIMDEIDDPDQMEMGSL